MTELAHRTTGYVGADLSALCREAAMQALRENSKVIAEHIKSIFQLPLKSRGRTFITDVSCACCLLFTGKCCEKYIFIDLF